MANYIHMNGVDLQSPPSGFQGAMSQSKKLTYLSRFIKTTVDTLLPLHRDEVPEDQAGGEGVREGGLALRERVSHKVLETYTHAKVWDVEWPSLIR